MRYDGDAEPRGGQVDGLRERQRLQAAVCEPEAQHRCEQPDDGCAEPCAEAERAERRRGSQREQPRAVARDETPGKV